MVTSPDSSTSRPSATLAVRLQPRSKHAGIVGWRHGALVVRVTAAPVDGKANRALCELLARTAGVAPSSVSVVRGAAVREKIVKVVGLDHGQLVRALGYSP